MAAVLRLKGAGCDKRSQLTKKETIMSNYLIISERNIVDGKLFKHLKEIADQDPDAAFSIVDRTSLPVADFWADEKVKAYARRQAVETMAKLERASAPEPHGKNEFPASLPGVHA